MVIEQISLFASDTVYKGIHINNPHISLKQLYDPFDKKKKIDWICYDYKPKFAIRLEKFANEDWKYSYEFYGKTWGNGGVVSKLQDMDDRIEKQVENILKEKY